MISILIKRVIAPGMESTYEEFTKKLVQAAVPTKGFVSSHSFTDINNSCRRYILMEVETLEDWEQWRISPERQLALNPIMPLLVEPEETVVLKSH